MMTFFVTFACKCSFLVIIIIIIIIIVVVVIVVVVVGLNIFIDIQTSKPLIQMDINKMMKMEFIQ